MSEWIQADKHWSEYPKGTYARESWSGSTWRKTGSGWKYLSGSTFPTPGEANQVKLTKEKD